MIPTVPPTTDDVLNTTSNLLLGLPYWAWQLLGAGIVLYLLISIVNKLPFKQLFFVLLLIVGVVLVFGK